MPDRPEAADPREAALKRLISGGTISGLEANARPRKSPRRRLIAAVVVVAALILADWLGLTPEPVQAALQAIADSVCAGVSACD